MKRILILMVAIATALSLSTAMVSAATLTEGKTLNSQGMELFWVNTNAIDLGISYSGTTASCSGRITGNSNVNSITATFTLKKVNSNVTVTTVKTWSGQSSSTRTLNFSGTYSPVNKGETYRLEVSATLTTTGGVKETVSDSFSKTY